MSTAMRIDTPEDLRRVMAADFTFSPQQFAAITAPLEPSVVIAGAGSGKTTVMAARVVWLVATGRVAPSEILGLTFTTKATAELETRVRDRLVDSGLLPRRGGRRAPLDVSGLPVPEVEEVEEPTVATYHAYAATLLTEHGLRIGHEPDTRLIADASRYQLAARAVQRYREPVRHLTDSPAHVIRDLLALDAELSEHLVSPDQVRAYDAAQRPLFEKAMEGESRKTYLEDNQKAISAIDRRAELLGLVEAYRQLKADLGLMDFSDQIALAARLAQERPEVGALERDKFKVVLLDEYQDTSVAQALMLSRLFSGPDEEHGLGHPVTAVGDPNQAIYGWRGASVSNILDFSASFPGVEARTRTFPLTVNRRSDSRILATANQLASPLYDARPELRPLEATADAEPGTVRAACHPTYDDELDWLADQVVAAHAAMAEPSWREIGVLTRNNSHAADVFDALTAREVPVEIVGLKGLLRLPEVAEVMATLSLVQDVTDNPALLTLLAGPRWAIGPRDLALLGRRARELADRPPRGRRFDDLRAQLQAAVDGGDPTEMASLSDALVDPGDHEYSPEARERFAQLAAELRRLRAAVGDPLLDLVRRIVDTTGIDVELASSVSPAAAARRDNLDLFVQAVAEFQAVDGAVTLPALLAWLEAEDQLGQGLDVATPSEADSVKLLTVHRAKGLEWDTVFLVGVTDRKFPTNLTRSRWVTVPSVMPSELRGDAADVPQLRGHDAADIRELKESAKVHEATEELRLGYVAWTRARHELVVSGWCWGPQLKNPLGPSSYLLATREALAGWGAEPEVWCAVPSKGDPSPYVEAGLDRAWPISHHTAEVERRAEAARLVGEARDALAARRPHDDALADVLELERVQQWDDELTRLVREAQDDHRDVVEVPLPPSLSATSLVRLDNDPDALARELARPMPRRPSAEARFGTRFHAWVESRFGQLGLLDPDDLPGRGDSGIGDDADLAELIARFEAGAFAERRPLEVEPAFSLVLRGQVVRGRIDAVFLEDDGSHLVVDWKTNRQHTGDPFQLAVYRLAWSELRGLPLEKVGAAFYYVRDDDVVRFDDLPDRAGLEELLA